MMKTFETSSLGELSGFCRALCLVYEHDVPVTVNVHFDVSSGETLYTLLWSDLKEDCDNETV